MRRVGPVMFAAWMVAGAASVVAARDMAEPPRDAPVAVQRVALPETGLRDQVTMVLVGTALIGLAAALRRAA